MIVPGMPHAQQFLNAKELVEVRHRLWDMREGWRTVSEPKRLYTMGYVSYLDALTEETRPWYYKGNPFTNAVLQQKLGWLYIKLLSTLESMLGAPVRYRDKCAIPGFHLLLGAESVAEHHPVIHVDSQWGYLTWSPEEATDFSRTMSFTAAIELPSHGAGLNLWEEFPFSDVVFDTRQDFISKYVDLPSTLHEYSDGVIVLHSGYVVHQVAMGDRSAGNNRLTMQGHGVWCDGAWQIFW